jgi:hypothetical protein
MGFEMPKVPPGSGEHPIALMVVTANNLAASGMFYSKLFGWQLQPFSAELAGEFARRLRQIHLLEERARRAELERWIGRTPNRDHGVRECELLPFRG